MNRKQKIIVIITGIFIVLLALVGLTYAYFLTRITGNENDKSISVTTANLELVYGDGTTSILTSSNPIEPGKFSSSKDFTVTNNGNALTDYAVTLEDFSITYASDTVIDGQQVKAGTVTKMEYPEDMKMSITCTIESDDEDRNGQACGNIDGTLPTENSILLTNSIEVDDIHKYVLTLTYVDSGIDQSADMNKTIKGKIDIIDPKSTIDLTGTVATYQTGDYVEINSTPIKSEIVDGKYKLIGVEPGSHTLNVKYKDTEGNVQTRGSQTLTIKKGEEASVSGNTITFTDTSRSATVDVTESYGITVDETVKSSLRDAILANAMSGKYETKYQETPSKSALNVVYTGYTDPTSFSNYSNYTSNWYIYGEEITIDSSTGMFKIKDPQVGKFSNIATSIKEKYTNSVTGYTTESSARNAMNNESYSMYKVGSSTTTSEIYVGDVTKIYKNTINMLTKTNDDHGTSYYYRGGVTDNYVNFAGMCWRIVRIVGDGSIKLILEDKNEQCNDKEGNDLNNNGTYYTGNWSIGRSEYGYKMGPYNNDFGSEIKIIDYLNYEGGMADAFKDYQKTLETYLKTIDSNKTLSNTLKPGDWCYDDSAYSDEKGVNPIEDKNTYYNEFNPFYYGAYTRVYGNGTPSLKCKNIKNESMTLNKFADGTPMYVGAITLDEMEFAGGNSGSSGSTIYLINDYQYNQGAVWLLLSPAQNGGGDDLIMSVDLGGYLTNSFGWGYYLRPSITLLANTEISGGVGTLEKPYIIG